MVTASVVLLAGVGAAPVVFHHYDVIDCFLAWSRATAGRAPWAVYGPGFRTPCDYPPVVPYLLALVEAVRRAAGAAETGALAVILLKLPNLLAAALHAPVAWFGLRGPLGPRPAAVAAWLGALSPALFVNAALWGQFDALVSLLVLAAVAALLHRRAVLAGALIGLALATKLLAVVVLPVLVPWALRRLGGRAVLRGALVAAAVVAATAGPMVVAGAGEAVADAYTGAVGYYPLRTIEAYNAWYVLDRVDILVRGMPAGLARLDTRTIVGGLTHRHLGLALFALATAVSIRRAWGAAAGPAGPAEDAALPLLCALQFFAFFMLPTQMHQRYVLPAATLAAAAAGLSRPAMALALALAATAGLNQGLDLARAVLEQALVVDAAAVADPPRLRMAIRAAATLVALLHVGLFAWAFARGVRLLRPGP